MNLLESYMHDLNVKTTLKKQLIQWYDTEMNQIENLRTKIEDLKIENAILR